MGYLERDRNVDLVKAFPMGTNNIACGKAASAATLGVLFIRNSDPIRSNKERDSRLVPWYVEVYLSNTSLDLLETLH